VLFIPICLVTICVFPSHLGILKYEPIRLLSRRLLGLTGSVLDHYHQSSYLGVGTSEGCFIFYLIHFITFGGHSAHLATMCTTVAVTHQSLSLSLVLGSFVQSLTLQVCANI